MYISAVIDGFEFLIALGSLIDVFGLVVGVFCCFLEEGFTKAND